MVPSQDSAIVSTEVCALGHLSLGSSAYYYIYRDSHDLELLSWFINPPYPYSACSGTHSQAVYLSHTSASPCPGLNRT